MFVGQAGSPQKAVYELRDNSEPCGVRMEVQITGLSLKTELVQTYNNNVVGLSYFLGFGCLDFKLL